MSELHEETTRREDGLSIRKGSLTVISLQVECNLCSATYCSVQPSKSIQPSTLNCAASTRHEDLDRHSIMAARKRPPALGPRQSSFLGPQLGRWVLAVVPGVAVEFKNLVSLRTGEDARGLSRMLHTGRSLLQLAVRYVIDSRNLLSQPTNSLVAICISVEGYVWAEWFGRITCSLQRSLPSSREL